jgi:hypothetical protein
MAAWCDGGTGEPFEGSARRVPGAQLCSDPSTGVAVTVHSGRGGGAAGRFRCDTRMHACMRAEERGRG